MHRINKTYGLYLVFIHLLILIVGCSQSKQNKAGTGKPAQYNINRHLYIDKLAGFWLGESIANWSGLVTEMDKIGNIGEIKTGPFYTRQDWHTADQPSIWGEGKPSELSSTVDYVLIYSDSIWGADDDTDIEYMYQELLLVNHTNILTGKQIRDGWLKHIKLEEENYLWVANQKAFDLMNAGFLPPETSDPEKNEFNRMIDAQLTTEIFGLYAPNRPDIALKMAELPILTVARGDAKQIAEFYVILYSLASSIEPSQPVHQQLLNRAEKAAEHFPNDSYMRAMYDFVKLAYKENIPWEQARDSLYYKFQVNQEYGYDITSQNLYCNGCFAAGINYGASLISLFYGNADLKETIKIGMLCGWDADNPTATWGGLLGFIYGREHIRAVFGSNLSDSFNIHRTRINYANDGRDSFNNMARKGRQVIDHVVLNELAGAIDSVTNNWILPIPDSGQHSSF